jgi:tRNA (pseudouridine54-N1)-methyltransferase
MSVLQGVLASSKRNFIIIAHRARSDDRISLNDLCGASGRWDGVARSINAALHLSHGMRRDTSIHILLLGPEDQPKLLTVNGESVRYLNPDERASSALMKKCLKSPLGKETGSISFPSPGITLTRIDLDGLLSSLPGPLIELHEDGNEADPVIDWLLEHDHLFFLLSDDMDLTDGEVSAVRSHSVGRIRLGPSVLHSNMAITVVHYILDLKTEPARPPG